MHNLPFPYIRRSYNDRSPISKVDLSTFALNATLEIPGVAFIKAMTIDTTNATQPYLYVGTAASPAVVAAVDLSTFTLSGSVVTADLGQVSTWV